MVVSRPSSLKLSGVVLELQVVKVVQWNYGRNFDAKLWKKNRAAHRRGSSAGQPLL